MALIGRLVTWKHLSDGKPTVDFSGEVVAVELIGADFRLLVQTATGELKKCDHGDVMVLDCFGEPLQKPEAWKFKKAAPEPDSESGFTARELEGIISVIDTAMTDLGFGPESPLFKDLPLNTTNERAVHLIKTLFQELAEAEAACEDLRNALALIPEKKKPGRPKKTEEKTEP